MRRTVTVFLGATALATTLAAQGFEVDLAREGGDDMKIQPVAPPVSVAPPIAGATPSYSLSHVANVASLRVHVVVTATSPAGWSIRFSDSAGPVETVPLAGIPADGIWSTRIHGAFARVELLGAGSPTPSVVIDRYAFEETKSTAQAIHGSNDLWFITDAKVDQRIRSLAPAVGKLRFMTPAGESVCSGFLLTATLFMTNNHCIDTQAVALSALVELGYDTPTSKPAVHRVRALEVTDAAHDVSVLRLATPASPSFGHLRQAVTSSADKAALWIVQHPRGEPKQVSVQDCRISGLVIKGVDGSQTDFGHECDTRGGSSGSPVLDTAGEIVGLHHLGFIGNSPDAVNQGVHFPLVTQRIKQLAPALYAELLAAGAIR